MAVDLLSHDVVIPGMQPLPRYLATTRYKNPTEPRHLPFNLAFGQDLFFQWLPNHPEVLQHFQRWMTVHLEGHSAWLDFYPFKERVLDTFDHSDEANVLLVDVGGNMGQELLDLKSRIPSHPGRMILQDLPSTIERVIPEDGMEAMAHDFFEPQPIHGTYYMS